MTCINLRDLCGDRFRVEYEASYQADRGDGARAEDPWLMIVLCENGHLFVCGGDRLGASTDQRGPVATKLVRLDCTTLAQDGDDGVNVVFDVKHFYEVAEIMKPRKRRRLSPEHLLALQAGGAKTRFRPGTQPAVSDQITHPAEVGGSEDPVAGPSGLDVAATTT